MIKYSIEKSANGDYYVLWKNVELERGFCCKGIFTGTRSECYKELKRIKGEENDTRRNDD